MIVLPAAKESRLHDHIFICMDKSPEHDGQTDRQTARAITVLCIASNVDML